jgi:hypothetical protein
MKSRQTNRLRFSRLPQTKYQYRELKCPEWRGSAKGALWLAEAVWALIEVLFFFIH